MSDEKIKEALDAYKECDEAWADNRKTWLEDVKFARLAEQWPEEIKRKRETEGRPCLTINKLPSFIRQVINDARQNKPAIKVRPVDDSSDPATAEVINGLIRNIEYSSGADIAYDVALDAAVTGGFGFFRIDVDYAFDDTFDMDILIRPIGNPLTVLGDPRSKAFDSSDWDVAFVTSLIKKAEFEARYKGAEKVDWSGEGYDGLDSAWLAGEDVRIAEHWMRNEVTRKLVQLSDGSIMRAEDYMDPERKPIFDAMGITVAGERDGRSYEVIQRIMTGAEVLEENKWQGKYIPIIPVYGEEVNVEGVRFFRSMVRDAKDPQQMFNYWRTMATELVALAPKAPWVGRKGAFSSDPKWATANTVSHQYLEYNGDVMPQRQPFAGVPAGALQEALNASDDIKAIIGMYDASLGARSNETSGKAILARQREGDINTFHFVDNLARSIKHAGRILIDLIPKIYTGPRVVRILGQDETPEVIKVNQQIETEDGQKIYDLTAGKYDLTVEVGPSYNTKRQESAEQMTEMIRAFPAAAPIIGDLLAKNLDWPGADEIAERLKAMVPQQGQDPRMGQLHQQFGDQMQKMQGAMQQMGQKLAQAEQRATQAEMQAASAQADMQLEAKKVEIDAFKAETERIKVVSEIEREQAALAQKTYADAVSSPDIITNQQGVMPDGNS